MTEEDLKGRPSLVFFGFTHCPDVCPTTLFDISQIMRVLGPDADRTRAVFITVDPERDTQEVLKDYLSSFDPHVVALTGDLPAIAARWPRNIAPISRRCRSTAAATPWTTPPSPI